MSEKEVNTNPIRFIQTECYENAWFLIELLAVVLLILTAVFYFWDQEMQTQEMFLLFLLGFSSWTDLRYGMIPNVLIGIGAIMGIYFFLNGPLNWIKAVSTGLGLFILFLSVRWLSTKFLNKPGFGMGDVKLFAILGLLVGYNALWVTYLAIMIAGLWAAVGLALEFINKEDKIPLAPFITVAFSLNLFFIPWSVFLGWWL